MQKLITALLIICGQASLAQTQDANIWASAGVGADLTKNISLSYEMQTRFYKNATALDSYINEIGIAYEPFKNAEVSGDYRYSRKNQESHYEGVHRLALNLAYDYKIDGAGLRIKARIRYQVPFNYLGVINDAIYPDNRNVMRFKLSAKYTPTNLKKIQPFASYEFYKALSPKNIYNPIDSYRVTFGVSFDLPKRHSVDLYYLLEKEYRSVPHLNHIFGIQYGYEIFKDPVFEKPESK
jgi:Protein of unknown function (DUF2490)